MEWLCGWEQDWEDQLFWRPGGPEFKPCTKHVLLPLLPGALLLLLTPFEVNSWRSKGPGRLAFTCHWLAKVLAVVGLAGVRLAELGLGPLASSHWWFGVMGEVVAYTCFMVMLVMSRRSAITTLVHEECFDHSKM